MDDLILIMENLRFLNPHLLADKHVTPLMCETAFAGMLPRHDPSLKKSLIMIPRSRDGCFGRFGGAQGIAGDDWPLYG